jgi:hypothetical protein
VIFVAGFALSPSGIALVIQLFGFFPEHSRVREPDS